MSDKPESTISETEQLVMDINQVPDFWDECETSERLATHLISLGYTKNGAQNSSEGELSKPEPTDATEDPTKPALDRIADALEDIAKSLRAAGGGW